MRSARLTALLFTLLALPFRAVAAEQVVIVPDRQIQAQIERTWKASTTGDRQQAFVGLSKLQEYARKDEVHFIRQLFYYYCRHDGDEERAFFSSFVVPRMLVLRPGKVAEALTPFLGALEKRIRQSAESWLRHLVEGRRCEICETKEFSPYRGLISRDNPPEPLVAYLYRRSPSAAVLLMREVFSEESGQWREVLWAEHVIRTAAWEMQNKFHGKSRYPEMAIQELEKLARHEQWWVRLYAVHLLVRYRWLHSSAAIHRLQDDPHPLVRETLARFEKILRRQGKLPLRDSD